MAVIAEPVVDGSGLLIGYGSVGAHHGRVLAARYGALAVVDSDAAARDRARAAHADAVIVAGFDELDAEGWDWAASRAAVATWGPSHAAIVDDLLDRGVRHLLVEKPMASSVAAAAGMAARASELDARLGVHHQRRVSGIVPAIAGLAEEHGLGPLVAVTATGGARCLVTNGMHWLDLACALFGEMPRSVVSDAHGEPINPRSPDLHFYGGTASWTFSDDRNLTLTFTNRSSVAEGLVLWYRDARVDLAGPVATVWRRPPESIDPSHAITRTGAASERVGEQRLADVLDAAGSTTALWREIDGDGDLSLPPAEAVQVLAACIAAVASGASGTRIELPIDHASELGATEWPIS